MASLETPAGVLAELLSRDPARPLYTFYDDATGERVELSVKSFENWVAKTANLLQDGLGTEPGDRIAVMLPTHWQGAVWMLAAWTAGLVVDLDASSGASVLVTGPETVQAAAGVGADEVVALSLRPLGGGFTSALPKGVLDYGAEVPAYGDVFTPAAPTGPEQPLLTKDGRPLDGLQLVAAARARAEELGLHSGSRLLTGANPVAPDGYLDALLAPLVRLGSVVLVRNPDPGRVDRHAADERVTHNLL